MQKHNLIVDDLVYYLSNVNDDPCLRLFIPKSLRIFVVKQYHDQNEHMGVQKTFDSKRQKYYWPNLFKEINTNVSECIVCQTRSMQKIKQPLQETDIPPNPMAKLSLDFWDLILQLCQVISISLLLLFGIVVGQKLLLFLIKR